MTARTEHPAVTHPFADVHEVAPSRWAHVGELGALAVITAGDAVAFQQIVARYNPDSQDVVVWALVVALAMAATFSMHLAGKVARARKANAATLGQRWLPLLLLSWLGLGLMAFWFRVAAATAGSEPALAAGSGFGAAAAVPSATELPMAALLLGLYLVGGVSAFALGHGMHNPARTAYLRAHRRWSRADKRYVKAVRRHDEVLTGPTGVLRWLPWRGRTRLAILRARLREVQRDVDSQVERAEAQAAQLRAATASHRRSLVAARHARHARAAEDAMTRRDEAARHLAALKSELEQLRAGADLTYARQIADSQADQLRQTFRHRLSIHLGDPASTSGVFSSTPNPVDVRP